MNPAKTLKHWADAVSDGGSNGVTVGSVRYTWDVNPRAQKNGALIGRITLWERGENPRDAGAYKINADGSVDTMPVEALRGILVAAPAVLTQFDSAFTWEENEAAPSDASGMTYAARVEQLEAEGLDRSDAQGVADAEAMQGRAFDFDPRYPMDPHAAHGDQGSAPYGLIEAGLDYAMDADRARDGTL